MTDGESNAAQRLALSALYRLLAGGRMLCDGALGTMLSEGGLRVGDCCDELNRSQPEIVASIHAEYLKAGAEMLETNTFGANAHRLARYGLRDAVREINLAGVRIARESIARSGLAETLVAGSVGPLGVRLEFDAARAAFAEQMRALSEGGADLLIVETITSLAEAAAAIGAAKESAPGLRVVAMMTVGEDGNCLDGTTPVSAAARLTDLGADVVGCNCSTGPAAVLAAIERMRAATGVPLAAMPSAGLPRMVDGRSVYAVSPEEMADFTRRVLEAGASLVGGCCGTTPSHTRAMRTAMAASG